MGKYICIFVLLMTGISGIYGQQTRSDSLIQFSGLVVTEEQGELVPLPLTNISILKSNRGTFSTIDGLFSIVAVKGETVRFSAVGYQTVDFTIPTDLEENRYSIYQIMTVDTINLPEAFVYPWPSREHFKEEFLAMEVNTQLQGRAEDNLEATVMARLRENLPADGVETGSFFLRKQAESYYSFGQAKPMNILNPIAWSKFIKAWKDGDLKRKDKP